MTDDAGTQRTYGDRIHVTVTADLGTLTPTDVRVQAVVGKVGANRELLNPYSVDLEVTAQSGTSVTLAGYVHCDIAGHQGYTVRIVPYHPVILVPSELPLVIWE